MVKILSALGQRIAFKLARFSRPPRQVGDRRGRLIADDRKRDGVVLLWALDSDLDAPKLQHALAQLSSVKTKVLVTTALDMRQASQTGFHIEAIPGAAARRMTQGKDWSIYLERRFARIRESWDPDLEVMVGTPLDAFLRQVNVIEPASPDHTAASLDYLDPI